MNHTHFKEKINEALEKSELSLSDFSEKICISRQALYKLMDGSSPKVETIEKIADLMEWDINYLIGRENIKESDGQQLDLNKDELEIINGFRKLQSTQRIRVLGYIEGLLVEK